MNKNLKVSKSIHINASLDSVWEALTNPEQIAVYLFGTEVITDWKVGSSIVFQGEYEGQKYKDKGNVLVNNQNECLKYNYWSGFSGLEDLPGNYSLITYELELLSEGGVQFTWGQEGFPNEQGCEHSENTLYGMLEVIKKMVEAQ